MIRLRSVARAVETIAFICVVVGYLLPFVVLPSAFFSHSVIGLFVFFTGFVALVTVPWPAGFVYFLVFSPPLVAAIIALVYRRAGRKGITVRLSLAVAGFAAMSIAYLEPNSWGGLPFGIGFYAADISFAVAALAAAVQLLVAMRLGRVDEPVVDEVAVSAMQELVRRYRHLP